MPKYVIERNMTDVGSSTQPELCAASQKSNDVLAKLSPRVQWQHSYVTADKLYCVYIAEDEAAVYEHAECGGFPANKVSEVATIIDPTTGE